MKLKVIQYNIKSGFRNTKKPYLLERKREKLAQKIIERENPDILILNEAYFESKNKSKILMDYQKIFKFPFYAHGNYNNGLISFWGNALLSKYPIIKIENENKRFMGILKTQIKVEDKIINLDVTHVPPMPLLNNREQKMMIKQILKTKKKNYILTGDFNSLSPEDDYDKIKMINVWSKFTKNTKNLIKEMLKRDAIKFILSKKLIDTYKSKNKNFNFTIPTNLLSKNKSSGIRIDYIFCSRDFKIIDSGIIKDKLTEKTSDHYPIYAILE